MTANNPGQDDYDPSQEEGAGDFSYEEESFNEGDASEEESWDKNFEEEPDGGEGDDGESQAQPGKKSGLFNILLIAAAVLGGGAFVYLKVLAPGASAPATQTIAEMPAAPDSLTPIAQPVVQEVQAEVPALPLSSAPSASEEVPAPVVAEAPLQETPSIEVPAPAAPALTSDSVLNVTPEILSESPPPESAPSLSAIMKAPPAASPPMPSPMVTPEETAPVPEALSESQPAPDQVPTVDDMPVPPFAAEENAPAEAVAPAGISEDTAKAIEQKLSVVIARLDTFEGRIASLEGGLHDLSSKVPAAPAAASDTGEITSALKALEQKIISLEKAGATPAAVVTPAAPALEKPVFVPAPEPVAQAIPVPQESITPPTPAPVKTQVKKPVAAAAQPKVTAWVLRSAQPGSAMVSAKSGGDMKSIHVGDTLSGLGRILSIEQKNGRWVVKGTQSSLSQ